MSEDLNEFERVVLKNIKDHGCHALWVFDPDGDSIEFVYSIGFEETVGQPEVLISGLPPETSKNLINDTLALCRDGFELRDFTRTDRIIAGLDCVFRDVREDCLIPDYFGSAMWYFEHFMQRPFDRAVQLVWPDREGNFPWEPDFSNEFSGKQEELWDEGTGS